MNKTEEILGKKEALVLLATKQQNEAADPEKSVWVEASAGTGKTKVLSDRVLRLLLNGVSPSKILCLTYTKAAAVEMNTRISKKLGEWAVMPEDNLREEIYKITAINPGDTLIKEARVLFAKVLEEPSGIKIQTMHSFCEEILKRFPIEAGIAPYFTIMDDRSAKEALNNISKSLILNAQKEPESVIGKNVAWLTANIKEFKFAELLRKITENRNKITVLLSKYADFDDFVQALQQKLGVSNECTIDKAFEHFVANLKIDIVKKIADVLVNSSQSDKKNAQSLYTCLECFDYDIYKKVFITGAKIRDRLACKDAIKIWPEIVEHMSALAQEILDFENHLVKIELYNSTKAIISVAEILNRGYAEYKNKTACLDFEDLVIITKKLLEKENISSWVLYKLDGGISHILIDEAQDTSPNQWSIIKSLTDEFFDGLGQKEENRTIFAVGDRKQSIYSFQGADPEEFDNMYHYFASKDKNLKKIHLDVSFRSTKAVLESVNHLFNIPEAKSGVVIDGQHVSHLPYRLGEGGKVILWPLIVSDEKSEDDIWYPPVERKIKSSASSKLATKIASNIKKMVENKEILESQNRPIRYSDFMVLVQRRNAFMEEFVRECKNIGVNVSGVDKLKLLEQIAVQDLLSLAQFLLLPQDDLKLAEILKSPLFGLNDEDLFELCYNRKEHSLWQQLRANTKYEAIYLQLSELIKKADYLRPFELFNYVLTSMHGRKKFVSRLGSEAEDSIDEFINLSLSFEIEHIPNLQNFIQWINSGEVEIKRELEQAKSDSVRIMTAHGSKGLQAPIVIIPDSIRIANVKRGEDILFDDSLAYFPLSATKYDSICDDIHTKKTKEAFDEYRRLLYVALTRAEDRLYIAGYKSKGDADERSWYALCEKMLQDLGIISDDKRILYECEQELECEKKEEIIYNHNEIKVPYWLFENVKEESALDRPYTPSKPDDDEMPVSSPLTDNTHYYKRGLLIHSLLQFLPTDVSIDEQINAVKIYLKKHGDNISPNASKQIEEEIIKLITHPKFSFIFSKESRAEVPIAGEIDGRLVSAQIDRLVISDTKVAIVDFKTNRPAATNINSIPKVYIKQLKTYEQLMKKIYPDKDIETYILWTNTANLMQIV